MMTKMKLKIVLEVYMPCDKCKRKATKIVASSEGMISMAIDAEKNQLVVVGVGMDAAILATSLRKKVGRTTIISVEEVKEEKITGNVPSSCNNCYICALPPPFYPGYDVRYGDPSYFNSWFSW